MDIDDDELDLDEGQERMQQHHNQNQQNVRDSVMTFRPDKFNTENDNPYNEKYNDKQQITQNNELKQQQQQIKAYSQISDTQIKVESEKDSVQQSPQINKKDILSSKQQSILSSNEKQQLELNKTQEIKTNAFSSKLPQSYSLPKIDKNQKTIFDSKKFQSELIEKAKESVAQDIQKEIKRILQNKNQFYHLLTQKIANKPPSVQEQQYEQIAQNYSYIQPNPNNINNNGPTSYLTRNYNTYLKHLSEQPRKIIDHNLSTERPSLQNIDLQNNIQSKLLPIKTNTQRLHGLLYRNVESTMNYYDKRIAAEKFLAIHGGQNTLKIPGQDYSPPSHPGNNNVNQFYDQLIKQKQTINRYQNAHVESSREFEENSSTNSGHRMIRAGPDFHSYNRMDAINNMPIQRQNPEVSYLVYEQMIKRQQQMIMEQRKNFMNRPELKQLKVHSGSPLQNIGQQVVFNNSQIIGRNQQPYNQQFNNRLPSSNSIIDTRSDFNMSFRTNSPPYNNNNNLSQLNKHQSHRNDLLLNAEINKEVIFVKKNKSPIDKNKSKYNHIIDVRAIKSNTNQQFQKKLA